MPWPVRWRKAKSGEMPVDGSASGGFVCLQAEVTFESQPGQTYFLQAGGFGLFQDPEFPEFSSLPEYGLLRISVSG